VKYVTLPHFDRKFDAYQRADQEIIYNTIEAVKNSLETSSAPFGLRIKRLNYKIYEARIDIKLRIAFYRDKDVVKFFCLGNHEDIARCLKRLSSIKF